MKTTRSTFGSIRVTLALLAVSVSVSFCMLAETFMAPKLVESRAEAVLSMIRSHEDDIILHKTRAVRDELLRSGTISDDQNFSHYFMDEKPQVQSLLKGCRFLSNSICLGSSESVFLAGNSENAAPKDSFKFAVVLNADLSRPPLLLRVWEGIVALLVGAAFWMLHRAIARKERFLLSRLDVATHAFARARVIFGGEESSGDEFDAFGRSAEELARLLEDYKAKFERKTRLEQLGLIVGQVSHDLKAPFNEAENFLNAMPLLLESATREEILEGTASLAKRIRYGKEAIQQAIQFTKRTNIARAEVSLAEVFRSVGARAHLNSKLQTLSLALSIPGGHRVTGDQIQLETAFLNLLENSADEKSDASVEIGLEIDGPSMAKITYTDNGGGIPEELLDRIFEPLVTFKAGGTGLGLSSTREIVTVHGGAIRALPHQGGARFEVRLPLSGGPNA